MPDWFYRTVGQPLLFALPDAASRRLALGTIGILGRNRLGTGVIDFLGHMAPDAGLAFDKRGIRFSSPMGIGWRVDPEGHGTAGLARFGVGCIEVLDKRDRVSVRGRGSVLEDRLEGVGNTSELRGIANGCLLRREVESNGQEQLRLPNDELLEVIEVGHVVAEKEDCPGLVLQLGEPLESGGWRVGDQLADEDLRAVRRCRVAIGGDALLIVSGGVGGPEDALALREAGADLILVEAGLVYGGPGLVKRCNEALVSEGASIGGGVEGIPFFNRSWLWALGLGLSLFVGGLGTFALAVSRVLLPYDEHFIGMSWLELREGAPLLFNFMAHDRATLAGTMLGLGWLYAVLAWLGIRRSEHGAKTAVAASSLVGFASFFSFFGFGYFDALHAFVAAILFQVTVQVLVGEDGGEPRRIRRLDAEDVAWRRGQWGQLVWILHSVGLLGAGFVILGIGMTAVFVSEDLQYLCMSRDQVNGFGERLISVVAHDRATLGGMLLSSGVVSLLAHLWLYRKDARWLWWGMLGFGLPAYLAAIGVHFWVGYLDARHLAPAFAGMLLWLLGLMLSRSYLCVRRA